VDEFARFADANTVLLTDVPEDERLADAVLRETGRRMDENYAILAGATDQDGRPFRILRVPSAALMSARVSYDALSPLERGFFPGAAAGEEIEFYLPGSYLNFVIANDVVVTSKYWRPGLPGGIKAKDEGGRAALQAAFPGRTVVQVDATPLLYDGAGIHCYTRNQPYAAPPETIRSH
jgi:agmatine deiminase